MDYSELLDIYTTRYLNKKEIMYRLTSGIKINDFWPAIVKYRKEKGISVNLKDQKGDNFWLCYVPFKEKLEIIDENAKKTVAEHIVNNAKARIPKVEKDLIMDALIDEAFNSSVIEGAFSTKKRTKEIIQKKDKPVNISEKMN